LEIQDITNIKLLITVGILITLFLAAGIILFVVYYQRKMLLKEVQIKLMEKEKQLELFKASVEAEEQQKEKIARNLHDEINPLLTVLKFNLSKHRIDIKKDKFIPESLIDDEQMLDKAIEGIRTTCLDLIPSFLLQYGIIKSLEDYIRNVQQIEGVSAEFQNEVPLNELDVFDKQEQLNIYRVCLEILNNLFKHSKCTILKMTAETMSNSLVIEVVHNGKGVTNEEMDKYTEVSQGLGLKSLKARALILNATINYTKTINTASVKLSIPYQYE
jgi:two-component system NarL family sensor kinase